jgi:uncharacterized membrane protein YgcG/ssDNA-binding Zn-finger/Zn-ribbon topoisomerase 1
MLYCDFCETALDPYDVKKDKDAEENTYEVTVFTCPQCGGEIISEDDTAATFCSFCGASTILDSRISKENRPELIIPFKKTDEDCVKSYKKMMRRAVFAPKDLKDEKNIEKFRGIYMPYWIYSFDTDDEISVTGSKSHRKGDYIYTKHYSLKSDVQSAYHGLSYDASSSFSDNLSTAIAPFDMRDSKTFTPSFLSGFYADTKDVDSGTYISEARELVGESQRKKILKYPEYRKYKVDEKRLRNALKPGKSDTKLAMFPVWFLSYRKGDRVAYTVVNGQNGKAAADLPVDFKKYIAGSLLLAIPIFILLNVLWTITPGKMLMVAALLALVSIFISWSQMDRIYTRENDLDDRGMAAVRKENKGTKNKAAANSHAIKKGFGWSKIFFALFKAALYVVGYMVIIYVASTLPEGFLLIGGATGVVLCVVCMLILLVGGIILLHKIMRAKLSGVKDIKSIRTYQETVYKAPFMDKCRSAAKPAAGIAVALAIRLINPVHDMFYYLGAAICLVMTGWSFRDLIQQHNMLTTRKLRQLGKRGGDEASRLACIAAVMITILSASSITAEAGDISSAYTNADTGYRIIIEDSADLLTYDEEEALVTAMEPITAYGSAAFLSVDENSGSTSTLARNYYKDCFGAGSGTLFLIDMDNRNIWIYSDGYIYKVITREKAEVITDNIYRYASAAEYYECAANAYSQIYSLLRGERIAQPMKYISNGLLALILALLANFIFVSRYARLRKPFDRELLANMEVSFSASAPKVKCTGETKHYSPVSSGDSSSGGGSSGGGGGSSGGGSSGGGGGHSF